MRNVAMAAVCFETVVTNRWHSVQVLGLLDTGRCCMCYVQCL